MSGESKIIEGTIYNIYKPAGMTSFQVVDRIRRWLHQKKVGHAGTLDPFATGVLLVCIGSATKKASELMSLEKTYEGQIELGYTTDTDDIDGKVLREENVPDFSMKDVLSVLKRFEGEIDQIPPDYSAKKKNGQRLYRLARKGICIEKEPKKVQIYKIELLGWERPFITFRARCSKGTYMRSLARDIGIILQTGGYLKSLCRTRIGPYRVEDAYTLESFKTLFYANATI